MKSSFQCTEFSFVLKSSSIEGIGVFATHDIPAGATLLNNSFALRKLKTEDVPADLIKYCVYLNDQECLCPERFDRLETGWFINHSSTPNIARTRSEYTPDEINSNKPRPFIAIKDIKAGEEILVDYNYLNEPEHLKENFYRKKV